jgi:predicted 3-demethylubiquinone-9 3-methyltransferase (glyoxalase superfamily)
MKKITPFLWYDGSAEEAAKFYVSIFTKSKIRKIRPGPNGSVMGVEFELEGQDFIALKYGVSWQIIPTALGEMLQDKDAAKAQRVMQAMLQMKKIDIQGLKEAYGR